MTPAEREFAERLRSREWRLANLYQIRDATGQVVPFVPRPEQWRFLTTRHNRNFVPKARKLGISTAIVIDNLDACIWTPGGIHAAHIDLTQDHAEGKIDIAATAWTSGPNHPKCEIGILWQWIHKANPLQKQNASTLEWANGSKQEAGVSFVGGTPQRLHWSEAGPLSVENPTKASRIRRQSMNAVPTGGRMDVETTMEGGTWGEAYALFKLALSTHGQELTSEDWQFWFFPWYAHPDYVLESGPNWMAPAELAAYFEGLEQEHGIKLTRPQKAWYTARARLQGADMYTQFPSTPDECIRSVVAGQIYPQITQARAKGRVMTLDPEPGAPLLTVWDIGISDAAAAWLVQVLPNQVLWLRHYEQTGTGAAQTADQIRTWSQEMGRPIALNLFPHDVDTRDRGSGLSYRAQLVAAGIPDISVRTVPRTPNIWLGIGELRKILARSYFDKRTDVPRVSETGADLPSGLGCLENYRRKVEGGREVPVHDHCSHTADAARQLAQAMADGLHVYDPAPLASAGPLRVTKFL